ncbi:MAG: FHA domain-containing protein, partial [Candidatus Saccharimonadales bacterium]
MHAFLTITAGQQAGASLPLDPAKKTRIGRGAECTLMLSDTLCSRVHAIVSYEEKSWRVSDAQSRNGTFLNGQKIDQAALGDGHRLRVGSTEFVFHESDQPPTLGPLASPKITQTLIKDTRVGQPAGDSVAVAAIGDSESSQELLLLYQLCLRALRSRDVDELMRVSLDVLRERTGASAVAFLQRCDDGKLSPKLVLPESLAAPIVLSESLTTLVC